MNVLEAILNAQGGGLAHQLGQQLGLDDRQTASALSAIVPALSAGLQRNASSPDGLSALLSALGSGRHTRYVEDPSQLGRAETVMDGNAILGHILGSKDVSRRVASRASAQTGVGEDVLKKMLPLAASVLMGTLAKQSSGGAPSRADAAPPSGGGILDMLTPLLDQNRDGSIVDDVLGMAGRFLGGGRK